MSARIAEPPLAPRSGGAVRLVSLVSAAMAFLALCALAAVLATNRLAAQWTSSLDGVATVRIAHAETGLDQRVADVIALLKATNGVAEARPYSEEELQELLAPWLGADAALAALPAPRLIDVRLEEAGPDVPALEAQLAQMAPGAVYDDHGGWRATLHEAASGLRRLALGALILAGLTAAGVVWLAARASVATNMAVVEALRFVGAEDGYISAVFERRFLTSALIGGVLGAGLAVVGLYNLPSAGADAAFSLDFRPEAGDWGWLALVPLGAAAVAWLATRISVLAAVRKIA
jgi:cell division transport system permease protein